MADEGKIPEYLKELSKGGPINSNDGFGSEDVAWSGLKGELDPDEIIAKHGQDPFNQLQLLLMVLVRGHNPDASSQENLSKTQKAITAITGEKPRRGKVEVDYHTLLQEVASRYFDALHANHLNEADIPVLPIVRDVLGANAAEIAAEHGVDPQNLERILVNKFNAVKDLYLARAASDHDYDRVRSFTDLNAAIKSLAAAGIRIDQSFVEPTRLAKNHKK